MIDPLRLVEQRHAVADGGLNEVRCACGARTRDATGMCRECKRTIQVTKMSTEQILKLRTAIDHELRSRRKQIDAALGGES